jgi:hypothetical protein
MERNSSFYHYMPNAASSVSCQMDIAGSFSIGKTKHEAENSAPCNAQCANVWRFT